MATTTNYGWETPDDTDLVKDGAAAMRTLGGAIDTTTKALNPETTLGDIAYRSSTANTNTRLAIGTNGQVLTVSSGVPAWTTISSASGLTYINTLTLSSTGTGGATIDNVFTSTYDNYKILIYLNGGSNSTINVNMQLRSGGTTTTSNYKSQFLNVENTSVGAGMDNSGTDEWFLGNIYSAYQASLINLELGNPQTVDKTVFIGQCFEYNNTTPNARQTGGTQDSATQFDGLLIRPSSGTISGKVFIYGYQKS